MKPGERKGFLTPLVTYLEGAKNGVDIDLAVNRVLAPIRRKGFSSSNRSDGPKVYGSVSEESTSDCQMDTEDGNTLKESEEIELLLRLCITDDKGMNCRPMSKDSVVKGSKIVKVMVDWSDKEHELYDANYLKDLPMVHKPRVTVKKTKQEAFSLFSCLDAFLKENLLGLMICSIMNVLSIFSSIMYCWLLVFDCFVYLMHRYCPGCKEHRQATKKLDLWRLPDIIVFHLKRFSYSRFLKNKLDTFVNFPIYNLDLSKYVKSKDACDGSSVYELYAISNHYGGLGGGHYSAYAKLVEEDRWYHFDDAHVTPVSEGDIKTAAAYLLFYKRVKAKPNAAGESSQVHEE